MNLAVFSEMYFMFTCEMTGNENIQMQLLAEDRGMTSQAHTQHSRTLSFASVKCRSGGRQLRSSNDVQL